MTCDQTDPDQMQKGLDKLAVMRACQPTILPEDVQYVRDVCDEIVHLSRQTYKRPSMLATQVFPFSIRSAADHNKQEDAAPAETIWSHMLNAASLVADGSTTPAAMARDYKIEQRNVLAGFAVLNALYWQLVLDSIFCMARYRTAELADNRIGSQFKATVMSTHNASERDNMAQYRTPRLEPEHPTIGISDFTPMGKKLYTEHRLYDAGFAMGDENMGGDRVELSGSEVSRRLLTPRFLPPRTSIRSMFNRNPSAKLHAGVPYNVRPNTHIQYTSTDIGIRIYQNNVYNAQLWMQRMKDKFGNADTSHGTQFLRAAVAFEMLFDHVFLGRSGATMMRTLKRAFGANQPGVMSVRQLPTVAEMLKCCFEEAAEIALTEVFDSFAPMIHQLREISGALVVGNKLASQNLPSSEFEHRLFELTKTT